MKADCDAIEFGMFLTGHDRETIYQMYRDWLRSNPINSECNKCGIDIQKECKKNKNYGRHK